MKVQISICILFICVLCPVLSLDPNWRLVFSDEFNGNTVDTNKWNVRDMKGNYGNAELQYYAPQQVSVFNGSLIITANNVSYGGMRYVSGWVDTKNLFYTTYGRYEFRAQMPDGGQGMWPAIWLLSQELCWPLGAEFDIMEYRGFEPNVAIVRNGYYHYSNCCGCGRSSASAYKRAEENLATSFHVYALEWTPDSISWFVDGTRSGFFEKKNLANGYTQFDPTPHYIIMNSAMGGGYAGNPDHSTRFPNKMYIDYVRVYHYSESCEGNTCSNHGCCDPNSFLCVCDSGWSGSSCEQWTGSFTNRFVSTNIQYTPATDEKVNGWDNGFSFYSDNNIAINNGLTLTLSTANCPSGCNGQAYSTGAWNSAKHSTYGTFTFIAKGPSVNGTGLSLQAAGRSTNNLLEQIAFVLTGTNRNFVQITTWHHNYQFNQGLPINLGFDASLGEHNYTFVWSPKNILFYIDGNLVRTATEVIPDAMGVYYAAQPLWYGGSFVYNGPSTIKVSLASWTVAPAPGNCSSILPCQPAAEGTGTGLTGDYYDGDTATRFFTNYKLTRVDPTINFNWGTSSPDPALSANYFSIRWNGQIQAPYSALYTFYSLSDDGVRLYVNDTLVIDAWAVQSATERSGTITLNRGVKYDIVLEYQETGGDAVQSLSWSSTCHTKQIIPQSRLYPCRRAANGAGNGLTGRYYSDRNLNSLVGTQIDSSINFNWGSNGPSALRNGQNDLFSISWTGFVLPRYSGNYTFYASSDDGSRLYVNGQLLVNQWVDKSLSEFSGTINLVQGVKYSITYQYYENGGGAAAYLYWSSNCEAKQIVPQSQLFSA